LEEYKKEKTEDGSLVIRKDNTLNNKQRRNYGRPSVIYYN
jgi:hypothetical protein